MKSESQAPGKIILSGEYAVVFGYPGIAVPSPQYLRVTFEKLTNREDILIDWPQISEDALWQTYAQRIISLCEQKSEKSTGILSIHSDIPLGKGMGSSTALVIAICRCLLGQECEIDARAIEDSVNPGNSGIDFAVIWKDKPLRFQKGIAPDPTQLRTDFLKCGSLIDTGKANESTPDLVAWVNERSKESQIEEALREIGECTNRLLAGEDPLAVFRDHHRCQVALGVVPSEVQTLIAGIEARGGAAKVLGAGGRTGGGGMVLALEPSE